MTKSLERWLVPVFSLMLLSACTPGGEASQPDTKAGKTGDPKPEDPEPEADPKPSLEVSVASVQMIQDCPDDEPEPSQAGSAEQRAPSAAMPPAPGAPATLDNVAPGDSFRQPCDQSTVVLALANGGEASLAVEVKAVRILSNGKVVGTLQTRKPKIWANNTYESWDQTVAPGAPSKVSYKLSMPSWSEVETAIGQSSFGHMFTLELDVAIDGVVQTVSSPEFPREEPHVIVT